MDFVDGHGAVLPVRLRTRLEPCLVAPFEIALGKDDCRRFRAQLEGVAVGVDLDLNAAVSVAQLELVEAAGPDAGDEQLPNPGAVAHPHRVDVPVPGVEVADDADPVRVGGPDGELHARDAVHRPRVGAEETVCVPVASLAEQVQIKVPDLGRKAVRVAMMVRRPLRVVPIEKVALGHLPRFSLPNEQVCPGDALQLDPALDDAHPLRFGQERTHRAAAVTDVAAEDLEGVVMAGFDDALEGFRELREGGLAGEHDGRILCTSRADAARGDR